MRVIVSKMALVREGKGERAKGRKVTRNKGNELFQTGRGALDRGRQLVTLSAVTFLLINLLLTCLISCILFSSSNA